MFQQQLRNHSTLNVIFSCAFEQPSPLATDDIRMFLDYKRTQCLFCILNYEIETTIMNIHFIHSLVNMATHAK